MMTLTVALVALVFGYGVGYQHGQERQWRQNRRIPQRPAPEPTETHMIGMCAWGEPEKPSMWT